MSNQRKAILLILYCLSFVFIIFPISFLFYNIHTVAAQPTPDMFIDYISYVVAGIVIGVPLRKYTSSELAWITKKETSPFARNLVSGVMLFAFIAGHTYMRFIANEAQANLKKDKAIKMDEQPPAVAQLPLKPVYNYHPILQTVYASSYWGTCTFVLYKEDGSSGGTKISNSAPNCVSEFERYFAKYACKEPQEINSKTVVIKSGQLNFGKKFNSNRFPAGDYFVLVNAKCDR